MTVVIIQCRLGSTRLPSKALLPLGTKTCIEWTLDAMKKIKADLYYLATDNNSFSILSPIAGKKGWECFNGSEHNVLDRFCSLLKHIEDTHGKKSTWIVRATGDNPFLFFEAAESLLENTKKAAEEGTIFDYATYTGLPHGSGVEILNAQSLLKAQSLTKDPYDTEHVGPALYNHQDIWNCRFLPSPSQWSFPQLRTTIDTYADYRSALRIVNVADSFKEPSPNTEQPYSADLILRALKEPCVSNPILCVPQTKTGFGTGHARRMIHLASKLKCDILIPDDSSQIVTSLVNDAVEKADISRFQIVNSLEGFQKQKSYRLIVSDYFKLDEEIMQQLCCLGPLVSIDDSIQDDRGIQYLIQVIPSLHQKKCNLEDIMLLSLPEIQEYKTETHTVSMRVLVCLGGEDPSNLAYRASVSCAEALESISANYSIDVISNNPDAMRTALKSEKPRFYDTIHFFTPIPDLSQKICGYDLVISHYGLTAFETCSLSIPLILLGTTNLHTALAKKYGFYHITSNAISAKAFRRALTNMNLLKTRHSAFLPLYDRTKNGEEQKDLSQILRSLSMGNEHVCPLCGQHEGFDTIECRTENKTVRRCSICGILYPSWTTGGVLQYDKSYFFEEYKKQYGKTYLEDFEQIKNMGLERVNRIKSLLPKNHKKKVLDVGCAYGPFLQAAKDNRFLSYGIDISSDAASYVSSVLKIPSCSAAYPNIDTNKEFQIAKFDAVTMWFVIEHFQNLNSVLVKTRELLNDGGVFVFSTPNASGVTRTFSPKKFFSQSPLDHYTLWELRNCRRILKRYGFKVKKIICTGHHSERFPLIQRAGTEKGSLLFKLFTILSRVFSLGDTFEVYCIKTPNKL